MKHVAVISEKVKEVHDEYGSSWKEKVRIERDLQPNEAILTKEQVMDLLEEVSDTVVETGQWGQGHRMNWRKAQELIDKMFEKARSENNSPS